MITVIVPHHGDPKSIEDVTFPFLLETPSSLFSQIIVVSTKIDEIRVPEKLKDRCELHFGEHGRGWKLNHGVQFAQGEWLLFLHSDTKLIGSWENDIQEHVQGPTWMPAVFKLTYDAPGIASAIVGGWGTIRSRIFGVPYGDQGLLIAKSFYLDLGGFRPDYPLMEDVELMQRIGGKGKFKILSSSTSTSAEKYLSEGWFKRGAKHWWFYFLYRRGVSPDELYERYYDK